VRSRTSVTGTPDMLRLGLELCTQVPPAGANVGAHGLGTMTLDNFFANGRVDWSNQTGLIDVNGDAEMWLRLCSLKNRKIVRVIDNDNAWTDMTTISDLTIKPATSLYWGDPFPANAPVMDHRGNVAMGLTDDNLFPICYPVPAPTLMSGGVKQSDIAAQFFANHPVGPQRQIVPPCPSELFETFTDPATQQIFSKWKLGEDGGATSAPVEDEAAAWAARGAVNAGLAVYLYLTQLERGQVTPQPPFNQCEQLATAGSTSAK
jgi:hypothetical protein